MPDFSRLAFGATIVGLVGVVSFGTGFLVSNGARLLNPVPGRSVPEFSATPGSSAPVVVPRAPGSLPSAEPGSEPGSERRIVTVTAHQEAVAPQPTEPSPPVASPAPQPAAPTPSPSVSPPPFAQPAVAPSPSPPPKGKVHLHRHGPKVPHPGLHLGLLKHLR